MWTVAGPIAASPRVRDVVESRFGRLPPTAREVLDALALAEPLEAAFLEAIADPASIALVEARDLLTASDEGERSTVRLAHPLYREVTRIGLRPLQVRSIARRLAAALEQTGARRQGDAARLAMWRLWSRSTGSAEMFLAGAEEANATMEYDVAERLARKAIARGAGDRAVVMLAQARIGGGDAAGGEELLSGGEHRASDADRAAVTATGRATSTGGWGVATMPPA